MATALKNLLETSSNPDYKAWADSIRARAEKWKDDHKRDWPDDADMRKGGREDAAKMNKIARMIETGKLQAARSAISILDTAVREQIPQQVWDGLGMSD